MNEQPKTSHAPTLPDQPMSSLPQTLPDQPMSSLPPALPDQPMSSLPPALPEQPIQIDQATLATLEQYQARFNAIVSNTPGLVFQCAQDAGGRTSFPYLSDGCAALLGIKAAVLQQSPGFFLQLILPEDRRAYLDAMAASAATLGGWNWEGRIWVDAWKDVKWINLRATPRARAAGGVLWEGIMSNITAGKLEQQEVAASHARLAELTAHIEQVKEQERTRIAREIHDELGGNLTAIKMALAMLTRRLPADQPQLADKAAYVESLVDRTIDAVHRISLDLRPSMLDFGIVAALAWQVREFEKQMGYPCSLRTNVDEIDLGLDSATALFRVFQEALTNIARHARASRVTVRLQRQRQQVLLRVSDNGVGIAQGDRAKPASFGLRGMHERVAALGGTLAVTPAATGGTVVMIKIPLPALPAPIIAAGDQTTSTNDQHQ